MLITGAPKDINIAGGAYGPVTLVTGAKAFQTLTLADYKTPS